MNKAEDLYVKNEESIRTGKESAEGKKKTEKMHRDEFEKYWKNKFSHIFF